MSKRALVAVSDLMFQPRIVAALLALGLESQVAETQADVIAALDGSALVVIDLHATGLDAEALIRAARATGAGVLAFGRHTEPTLLRGAREAGADKVVARSQLVEELPDLILQCLPRAGPWT